MEDIYRENISPRPNNGFEQEKQAKEVIDKWFPKGRETIEKKELSFEEKKEKENLREKFENVKVSPEQVDEIRKEAEEIAKQQVKEKIVSLLKLAKEKGLALAIKTARETGDEYLIDVFHDILAKDGLFKEFIE
ncbi:hypothetical protein J7J23_03010 [bacterium]|nr:hypothetical protein [bacterium]